SSVPVVITGDVPVDVSDERRPVVVYLNALTDEAERGLDGVRGARCQDRRRDLGVQDFVWRVGQGLGRRSDLLNGPLEPLDLDGSLGASCEVDRCSSSRRRVLGRTACGLRGLTPRPIAE